MSTRMVLLDQSLVFLNGKAPLFSDSGQFRVYGSNGAIGFSEEANHECGIILGRVGAYCGSVAISHQPFWASDNTIVVKPKGSQSLRYWYYRLSTLPLRHFAGGAAQPLLTHAILRGIEAAIFEDVHSQIRAADVLSAYDDLIENNRRRMALLEEAARQLYREWFVRLRFPGHEHTRITNGVPEGWEKRPLHSCASFLSGGTPAKSRPEFWEGDIPWVSSGELTSMRLRRTSLSITEEAVEAGSRLVPADTILAVVRGMSLAKDFRVGLTARAMGFNQDLKAICALPDVIDPLFLFHAMESQREQIRDMAGEASHGTKKLDTAVLAAIPVLVPPDTLQREFKSHAAPIHAQWDTLDQQVDQLRAARDLLLPRLMSGEINV